MFMDFQKSTQLIQECPLCGSAYTLAGVRVVQKTEEGTLIYFKCSDCRVGLVAAVMEAPFGLLGSGLVTDLQHDEVQRFLHGSVVTEDDVLALHNLFNRGGTFRKRMPPSAGNQKQ